MTKIGYCVSIYVHNTRPTPKVLYKYVLFQGCNSSGASASGGIRGGKKVRDTIKLLCKL